MGAWLSLPNQAKGEKLSGIAQECVRHDPLKGWQVDANYRARSDLAIDFNLAAVSVSDRAGDRESETYTVNFS